MNALTLKYGSDERFLKDWGFADPLLRLRSFAPSTFTVRKAGGLPEDAADIDFEDQVTIYLNRIFSAGVFSGGTVIFVGRRTDLDGMANPGAPETMLQFSDAWYDLEHIVFQHYWKGTSAQTNFYMAVLNLFQDISAGVGSPWGYLTASQQIAEIIAYAQTTCGAPLQLGTVDPAWQLPFRQVSAISCAQAIIMVLESVPDVVTWFDYTTSPPALHLRQRANLTALTLPYAGNDNPSGAYIRYHQSSRIKSRPDLIPPQVVIQYRQTSTSDGKAYTTLTTNAEPVGSNGQALRALVIPIDLRGGDINTVTGIVNAVAIDPTATAFWKKYKPDLADTNNITLDATTPILDTTINGGGGHPDGITVQDESGADVSLATYPRALMPGGDVASWMYSGSTQIVAKEVTITGWLKYKQKRNLGSASIDTHQRDRHKVSVRLKLTNSAAGAVTYRTVSSATAAEPVPAGLAAFIYDALQQLQFEGHHTIVEDNIYQIIGPQHGLNLADGATEWETMQAAVYETEIDFGRGKTTVNFGPHRHLSAQQFFSLITAWAWRRTFENPNIRNDAIDSKSGALNLPSDSSKENTEHGDPDTSLTTLLSVKDGSNHYFKIQHDAQTNQAILMETIDVSGNNVAAQPKVNLKMADIGAAAGTGRIVQWRELTVCQSDGTSKLMRFAATEAE